MKRKPIMWNAELMREYVEDNGCKWLDVSYGKMKDRYNFVMRCGHFHNISFDVFKSSKNKLCRKCMHKINSGNTKYNIKNIVDIVNNTEAELISKEYKGIFEDMKFRCKCGCIFTTNWSEFNNSGKQTCNKCSRKRASDSIKLNIKDIKRRTKEMSKCILVSDSYVSAHKILIFRCGCGREFKRSWANFTNENKRVCSTCSANSSVIEDVVATSLEELNIQFNREEALEGCEYKIQLRFDFYLPKHNVCIEVDGRHHYEDKPMFGEDLYDTIKARDEAKDLYCKDKNIKLIRIPYWHFENGDDISYLIESELSK